jgi:hypothetical protein
MATLDLEITELDRRIDTLRSERDRAGGAVRERLDRQITVLDVHERAAIQRRYAERAEQQSRQELALLNQQQAHAAAEEARIRTTLRRRWQGDDTSFAAAWPRLLEEFRVDQALGRPALDPFNGLSPKVTL